MFKKWVNKKSIFLISLIFILTVSVGGSFAYLYDKTDTFINTFKYDHTGDLVIDKVISHPYGNDYIIPEGIDFRFSVELGSEYANKEIMTSNGNVICDNEGNALVIVNKDGEVVIKDLPLNTNVTVSEIYLKPGFTINGYHQQTILIASKERNVVTFTNDYVASGVSGSTMAINGTKELDREWIEGDSFTFQLSQWINGEWVDLSTATVNYGGSHLFSFTDVISQQTYSEVGTYCYKISEVEGTIPGISYDNKEVFIDIIVTDENMDGALEIKTVKLNNQEILAEEGIYNVSFTFTNTYAPLGSDLVTINITKTLEDLSGQNKTPNGFIFELKDVDGNVIKTSEETTMTGQVKITLPFEPTTAGNTYEYTLSEKNLGQNGMTYDETVYTLEVSVMDNLDGTVSAYIYDKTEDEFIPEGATNMYQASFKNTYNPTDASSLTISGKKVLESTTDRKLRENEFTFELYASNSQYEVGEIVDTDTNDSQGNFALQTTSFSRVGTYYYIVKEKQGTLGGINYSDASYKVIVSVIDDHGTLKATSSLVDAEAIEFVNSYSIKNTDYTVSGTKTLINYDLEEGMFTFEMYSADENFTYEETDLIRLTKNKTDGSFTFDAMTYSQEDIGTKYYVIVEKDHVEESEDFKSRIDFDHTIYGVIITISDDLEGGLKITQDLIDLSTNKKVDHIKFINTYTPPAKDIDISVNITKTVEIKGDEVIGPEGFTFVLTEDGKEIGKVETDEIGKAIINVTYSEKDTGTHTYILKELNEGKKHLTYDQTEYVIIIDVVLTSENELVATYEVNGEEKNSIECSFVNIYDYTRDSIQTGDMNLIIPFTTTLLLSGAILFLLKKKERLIK